MFSDIFNRGNKPNKKTQGLVDKHRQELNSDTALSTGAKLECSVLSKILQITKPHYWSQDSVKGKAKAWALLGGGFGLTYLNVKNVSLGFTEWNKEIGNYIQDSILGVHNNELTSEAAIEGFFSYFDELAILTGLAMGLKYASYKMSAHGVLNWRMFMTKDYHTKYTDDNNFYHIQNNGDKPDHIDQRIQEDPEKVADNTYDLMNDAFEAVITLALYSHLLWNISKPEVIAGVEIPKFEFVAIVTYAGLGVLLTHNILKPLIKLVENQQTREADYRSNLKSIDENREAIALNDAGNISKETLDEGLEKIDQNAQKVIGVSSRLQLLRTIYHRFANVVPLAIAGPQMITGDMKFGDLTELKSAFREIKDSLSFYTNRGGKIYTTYGYVTRLVGLDDAFKSVQDTRGQLKDKMYEFFKGDIPPPKINTVSRQKPNKPIGPQ